MTQETEHADGNAGRPLLPEVEGKTREILRSADLSKFDGASTGDRQAPQRKKKVQKLKARLTPEYRRHIDKLELNGADLAVLAPRRMEKGDRKADSRFVQALNDRMILYKEDGLEALRDLAMMEISQNSMQNNIKFLAAKTLVGNLTESTGQPTGMDKTLEALNTAFHDASRRIKAVRERVVEFEDTPKLADGTWKPIV